MQRKSVNKVFVVVGFFILMLTLSYVFLPNLSIAEDKALRFSSANPGGAWYVLAVGVTEAIKKENPGFVFSIEPGGGVGSTLMVGEKKVNMGFTLGGTAIDAIRGRAPFKKAYPNIVGVACLYNHYLQGAVLKKSGIINFQDIKGKTLTSGPKGQISWFWAQNLLKIYGIDVKDVTFRSLGFVASAEAVKDGHVDMMFIGAPMPLGPMLNLAVAKPMRLAKFDEKAIDAFCKVTEGFEKVTLLKSQIPYKGTEENFLTALTPLVIIADKNAPEDLIYNCVKAIAKNIKSLENVSASMKNFEPKDLAKDVGLPMHPGALKYFKEVGWR